DLIGPSGPSEILTDRPSDRYLTGILFPQRTAVGSDQDEGLGMEGGDNQANGDPGVALANTMRPASVGISFAVRSVGADPSILIRISCGQYAVTESARSTGD